MMAAATSVSTATPPVASTTRQTSSCRTSLPCWSSVTGAGATSASKNQVVRSRPGVKGWCRDRVGGTWWLRGVVVKFLQDS
jgi:hypothetical protein